MNINSSYVSSIPADSRDEDITGKPGSVRRKVTKNYYLGKSYVGMRVYSKAGLIERECSYQNGQRHGWQYDWYENGQLLSAIPYSNGREHGTASIWGTSGALLGTYTMDHGTGIDLWWIELDGKAQLTEARVVVDNKMDGYEYWFRWGEPGVLKKEKWWSNGELHGIEREWTDRDNLRSGFPKYYVRGHEVDRHAYDHEQSADSILRPYAEEDDRPFRTFPPEVAIHLSQEKG